MHNDDASDEKGGLVEQDDDIFVRFVPMVHGKKT